MATRSKGKTAKNEAQNKASAIKRQFDNRVFLLDGRLLYTSF